MGMGQTAHTQITATYLTAPYGIDQFAMFGDTLIVVGHTGEFYKSYDQGKTFVQQNNIPIVTNGYCFDFQVANDRYYYIATRNGYPNLNVKILKSADYGNTWTTVFNRTSMIADDFIMVDTTFGAIFELTFDTLWTVNGADTNWSWHHIASLSSISSVGVKHNDSTVTIFRNGSTDQTTDKGQTWTKLNFGCGIESLLNIQHINGDTIYFVGYEGGTDYHSRFLYTYDGGMTIQYTSPGFNSTFQYYDYKFFVNDLFFLNSRIGFLYGGFYYPYPNSNIMFTQDFGQTFTPLYTGYTEVLYKAIQVNDSIIVMGGENGLILRWNTNQPLGYLDVKNNTLNQQNISVYPNPFNHFTTFNIPQQQLPAQLNIYNTHGQLIFNQQINSTQYKFYSNNLSKGIYFYSVNGAKGKLVVN